MTKISLYVKYFFVNGPPVRPAFGFAHDVHHRGEDGAGPVDELAGEAAVGEDEPDRG
jgi:hypothetical protein